MLLFTDDVDTVDTAGIVILALLIVVVVIVLVAFDDGNLKLLDDAANRST